tara:strand:- start:75 stop:788 length:714 start_codon:yes stop_codon:yes gene_type:complete
MSFWDYVIPGYKAAKDAGQAQTQAADRARGAIARGTTQARADIEPWRTTGKGALYSLADLSGVDYGGAQGSIEDRRAAALKRFQASPGYEFRLGEGTKALERSASARGRLMSGATQKGLQRYGQGLASEEYGNYVGQLERLSGGGQQAASRMGDYSMSGARGEAGAFTGAGAARGSIYAGQANAVTGLMDMGMQTAGMLMPQRRSIYGSPWEDPDSSPWYGATRMAPSGPERLSGRV